MDSARGYRMEDDMIEPLDSTSCPETGHTLKTAPHGGTGFAGGRS